MKQQIRASFSNLMLKLQITRKDTNHLLKENRINISNEKKGIKMF